MGRMCRFYAACGLLFASGPAWAQAPSAPTPDLGAEAELHFDIGVRAYARRDYETALEHLLLSNRLAANRKVVFNIARAYEGLGKPMIAWSHYADFASSEPDPAVRAEAEQAMARLAPDVALVRVTASIEGAAIYIDRRELGQRGATPRTLAVDAGTRRIRVEAPGFEPADLEVVAQIGSTAEIDVDLEPVRVAITVEGTEGAKLLLDGREIGEVPGTVELAVGTRVLQVVRPGYREATLRLDVMVGRPQTVRADLQVATGRVAISAQVDGARIDVDGEAVGFVPVVLELPVGLHRVRVDAEDYRSAELDVEVRDGETIELGVRMVPRTDVVAASRVEESLLDAPGTVVVISRQDIRDRGYTDMAEVISDLPGFDAILANGVTYMIAWQRGYRTPQTQRTLLLTDGLDENLMWTQSAEISRQFPFTDIERIEVLYGPSSAVWGPNAFLGVVNVVTRDPLDLDPGAHEATVQLGGGSFQTGLVDGTVRGRVGNVGYSVAGRGFVSEEPDLSGRWGFVRDSQLADERIWGPLLTGNEGGPFEIEGRPLGAYADPTEDYGVRGKLALGGLEVGASSWMVSEGYGPYYATDRSQPVAPWNTSSERIWAQYTGDLSDRVSSVTVLQRKRDRIWGTWAEADPDGDGSRVSITEWNAPSRWWEGRQMFSWEASERVRAQVGGRWVRKDLTRRYDVPGYWAGQFSSQPVLPESGIGYSDDATYELPPAPLPEMPASNRTDTDNLGGFVQLIADTRRFRLNLGLRHDLARFKAGPPAQLTSPRIAALYRFADDRGALKLVYGRAFQEPSARQLWGEWSGRGSNETLVVETVDSAEVVAMLRTPELLLEGTVFGALYQDTLKEDGAGRKANENKDQQVGGLEARARWTVPNPLRSTRPMDGYANYTFTVARGTDTWNPDAAAGEGDWVSRPGPVGDIAPHKANAGLVVPMLGWAAVHGRTNVVSSRLPYSRNPLRDQGYRFPAYALFDALLEVHGQSWEAAVHIDNVFDAKILQPGPEAANAGDDFGSRSLGYYNSALPLPGRTLLLTWTMDLATAQ